MYRFSVWITACHGRVHEKKPKDTEETWIPTEEQREQAKSGFKIVFLGVDRDKSGRIGFFGRRAGRRVSVSKSGLSRRDRDGWQVCFCQRNLFGQMKFLTNFFTKPQVWDQKFSWMRRKTKSKRQRRQQVFRGCRPTFDKNKFLPNWPMVAFTKFFIDENFLLYSRYGLVS